jgi:acetyltransferase
MKGNDLVVVSRSGGHAVVAADAVATEGFHLMSVPGDFLSDVRSLFPADVIALTNPLDLGVVFDFDLYSHIVDECLQTLDPDGLLLVHTYSGGTESESSRRLVHGVHVSGQELGKPVAVCAFAQKPEIEQLRQEAKGPVFTEIEAALRGLAASRDRYSRSSRLLPLPASPPQRPHEVEGLVTFNGVLTADAALGLCAAFGIPNGEWAVVDRVEGALLAAGAIGYPVALKALSPGIVHKSDVGGVKLGIDTPDKMRAEFAGLVSRVEDHAPDADLTGILVQRWLPGGREVILGGKRDPSFGPVVMFGLGGIYVEVLRDVSFRLAPIEREDGLEMINEVQGSRLLRGVRGETPMDVLAVAETLVTLSELLIACPEVIEIDINPLLVFEHGVAAVDARVVLKGRNT